MNKVTWKWYVLAVEVVDTHSRQTFEVLSPDCGDYHCPFWLNLNYYVLIADVVNTLSGQASEVLYTDCGSG